MPENKGPEMHQNFSEGDWTTVLAHLWGPLMPLWTAMFAPPGFPESKATGGRVDDALRSSSTLWQATFGGANLDGAMDNLMKTARVAPDIAFGLSQACLQTISRFQNHVQTWLQNRAAGTATMDTQALDAEFIKHWSKTYQTEFSRYFKIPQIGLGRRYQERALAVMDAYNVLQARLAEFSHMLYLPMEKSLNQLREKMVEMANAGDMDDKPKTYYSLWIKLLEAQYMQLFQRPDYSAVMGQTLKAVHAYSAARQSLIDDILKQAAVPTQSELDELYKEIHLLKKRMRAYEKKG